MTLIQIKSLWEVVLTGNFTEAAEHLYITQSAVSKNIMSLEEELGIPLLDRSTRPYTLSPAGRKMMVHFGEIILAYDRAESTLQEIKRSCTPLDNNCFRLIGMPAITRFGVTASIYDFMRNNPSYNIYLEEMDEDRIAIAMQMGDCDVAFCTNLRINLADYNTKKYRRDSISILFSSDIAANTPLAEMANFSWIFPPPQAAHYSTCLRLCQEAGFIPKIVLTTSRPQTAMEYITNHRKNCAYMEITGILSNYCNEDCHMVPVANSPEVSFHFVWRKNAALPKAALEYLAYMSEKAE